MTTKPSNHYRPHELMHRRVSVDRLLLMRNFGYGGSAACLVILLALIQAGSKDPGRMVGVYSASIALPFWLLIGIVYEYYIFLGERSYPHLRAGLFVGVVGFSICVAGLAMVAAVGGIIWFLLPGAAYAFAASSLIALLLTGCFQYHITHWWFRDGEQTRRKTMMMPSRKGLAFLTAILLPITASAGAAPLLLTHATLIDGTSSPVQTNTTIVIEGARIQSIYPSDSLPVPKGANVEDVSGRYVIPGLIDAHVHISDVEPDIAHYQAFLKALLLGGVTGIRDMAGNARLLGYLAQQTGTDAFAGPDIFYTALMAGPSFFANDSRVQAAAPGMLVGTAPWMHAIDAQTDLPSAIAEAKGTGATAIKIYANLPASLVRAITAEAHRQGLRVWTHATIFPAKPSDAVAAGADTISHSPYLVWEAAPNVPDDYGVRARGDFEHIKPDAPQIVALFDAMHQRGTILDATLNVFRDEAEHSPKKVGVGIMQWSYAVTKLAREHGVLIDAGTDSSGLSDGSDDNPDLNALPEVHAEMALLVQHCGFTPLEAIRAATQIGAMAQGQSATRGTIAKDMRADLVVLAADPTIDIHNTTKIAFVVKDGIVYRRDH